MLHRTVAAKRAYLNPERDPEQARQETLAAATRIMEDVPCRNRAEFLYEYGTLSPEQAGYLGAALGAALASAHNSRVIHGAVEPGNVLLADDGGVKLTDIGVHGGATEPAYLAPE